VTVAIENDIIDTLKEMIEALKKARQDNQNKPSKPQSGSGSPPPQNQKLIEELQELKMIRNMQLRVNNRTITYGKEYPNQEQAPAIEKATSPQEVEKATMLNKELKGLADSQEKIADVTKNFYKEKNK
jgi:hypothetical protein